jgi:hypothetical protein
MLRRTPLKPGKGFRRPQALPRQRPTPTPVADPVRAVMARCEAANDPIPKQPREENPHYRAMARDRPCMLALPGICNRDWSTTVLAHSNSLADNKGKGYKSHDHAGVWACFSCHTWLDQSKGPTRDEKRAAFEIAMKRMRAAVEQIAECSRSSRDREAALWALERMRSA